MLCLSRKTESMTVLRRILLKVLVAVTSSLVMSLEPLAWHHKSRRHSSLNEFAQCLRSEPLDWRMQIAAKFEFLEYHWSYAGTTKILRLPCEGEVGAHITKMYSPVRHSKAEFVSFRRVYV